MSHPSTFHRQLSNLLEYAESHYMNRSDTVDVLINSGLIADNQEVQQQLLNIHNKQQRDHAETTTYFGVAYAADLDTIMPSSITQDYAVAQQALTYYADTTNAPVVVTWKQSASKQITQATAAQTTDVDDTEESAG